MGWLINAGDKFNLDNKNWEVIFIDNDSVAVARSEIGEEGIVSQRTIYKNWYEHQKQRADELELQLKETTKVAIDRLEIISNFKTFICESIDNAKEDCKKDDCKSNRLWLKAMQYVYAYGIKNFKENDE
ncbi:hypothetical protein [Macrococcus armenti]|uniref:hypothetical protein n=1 Tax=Macrococcus armenti TaxID=2875764 RepID=UPI001CD776DF|nr:hypothetical protein [Macrococcus armenti]UBH10612.1 hypothetical protein LAU38_10295 [Macrococcus armenti]